MALREKARMKRIVANSGGTLVADADESFRVTDVYCLPSGNDTYLTFTIAGVAVLKLRVAGLGGNHAPYPTAKTTQLYEGTFGGLFAALRRIGFDLTLPVAMGETLTVSRYADAGDVTLVYDQYAAGDVDRAEPNGSAAAVSRYLHYITNLAAVTATPAVLDTSLLWTGADGWPVDGSDVPSDCTYKVFGILGCPMGHGNTSITTGATVSLRLWHRGDVLRDSEDSVGFPFVGDWTHTTDSALYEPIVSVIGPQTAEQPYPPLVFDPPLEFVRGDKVRTDVVVVGAASGGIATLEIDVALLLESTRGVA